MVLSVSAVLSYLVLYFKIILSFTRMSISFLDSVAKDYIVYM